MYSLELESLNSSSKIEKAHLKDKIRHELAICIYLSSYMHEQNLSTKQFINQLPQNQDLREFAKKL